MEERGAEERCLNMTAFGPDKQAQSMSRRVPVLVDEHILGAEPVENVAPCRQRAHRSVEGGSELDASRAWASPKDVCRAFDAGTVDGCYEDVHHRRRWGGGPPCRPALG